MHITLTNTPGRCLSLLCLLLLWLTAAAQTQQCTAAGQTPATAINVCGRVTFVQPAPGVCSNGRVYIPGCVSNSDNNPHWYKITCYTAGTLGFIITPSAAGYEDYDWQLFDITNHNPGAVYTDSTLFVSGNWSGGYAPTGTNSTATKNMACGSGPFDIDNTFSKMPVLKKDHIYLLMVSHANPQSTDGYTLNFNDGTAVITDTTQGPPALQSALPGCAGNTIVLKANKKLLCSSVAANGSDFVINPPLATVTAAASLNCSTTGTDSILLTLSKSLPTGSYTITVKKGTDGNTVTDNCSNEMLPGSNTTFSIVPPKPVDMDSLVTPGCKPQELTLVFKKNINCASVAADGSDFTIAGPQAVQVTSAQGNCSNGLSNVINIQLSSPITIQGLYTITLHKGSDANTIIDECNNEVPAGQQLLFSTPGTVSAAFSIVITQACTGADTLRAIINNTTNITSHIWQFNDGYTDTATPAKRLYTTAGNNNVKLTVSNGTCSDTAAATFTIKPKLAASFTVPALLCPGQPAAFINTTTGIATIYRWYFGNGDSSHLFTPQPITYPVSATDALYSIKLIAANSTPCADSMQTTITVLANCPIAVATAFTPNGDNINDYLYPLNAYHITTLRFSVFNRWGQLVFQSNNISSKWDGTFKGIPQPTGVYIWRLSYISTASQKQYVQNGTTVLIR